MSHITIIAKIKSQLYETKFVFENLLKLIEPTRKEKGCINYILHRDNEDPLTFVFYENWETSEDLDAHMQSDHFIECFNNIEGLYELEVNKMTKV